MREKIDVQPLNPNLLVKSFKIRLKIFLWTFVQFLIQRSFAISFTISIHVRDVLADFKFALQVRNVT